MALSNTAVAARLGVAEPVRPAGHRTGVCRAPPNSLSVPDVMGLGQ
ncbi:MULTISPECIES: hypothetical protein [Streptomyces violaceusniger group]|nr:MULTISPECIES: hypothetical protein [Streptomyces violaceusniger group]